MNTITVKPKILYYGTPVVLLNTWNEDGTTNISPISSSWALGYTVVLGVGVGGKALENMQRHRECVLNLPDPTLWEQVERLAPYTGKDPVPDYKKSIGFSYQKDKFEMGGFTSIASTTVKPTRILECPLQLEAVVKDIRIPDYSPDFAIVETEVIHVHAHERILKDDQHIDPAKWSPILYNFRHYFGLGQPLGKTFRA
ncbi:flavin reductase family protein [Brevibacillus invocatus]|uniref:flavin reductase family protein n=1 Tax=Brevibacillus invocatus TaxID=173959 RepID=UPI00204134F2|nr:flavin reductase family protein [Brevibacillus invocatus]MCM3078635.1 flavin reductase family protein [Brevibacillus invocatus]MCM3429116.1 flavin reductase family protein [Brevibacillus invocatus]